MVCFVPRVANNVVTGLGLLLIYSIGELYEWKCLTGRTCWVWIWCTVLVIIADACDREASGMEMEFRLW